ncbi:alpha/beta fold hydrolase [Rhodoferax sp. GW822-FHT02A01]|uniref:alpha/beta hydrolase n=1 Tax=Rhodoferax sp. GW822-FHT02A01 TaxID=3141537 RepID=UPI00315CD469
MTEQIVVYGAAGKIEVLFDQAEVLGAKGAVLMAHPHPLLGGDARHKVVEYLTRELVQNGWNVYRPNFRGVGATQGAHDAGVGETDDLVRVCVEITRASGDGPLVLAGFSYGAYIQTRVYQRLLTQGIPVLAVALVSPGVGVTQSGRVYAPELVPKDSLIVLGQCDERVSLNDMCDWAEHCGANVVVLPKADHFYRGKLPSLSTVVIGYLERNLLQL